MNEEIKQEEDVIMTGVIEKCAKYRAEYFFIRGDDGKRYFGHRHQLADQKQYSLYCYEGNRVSFIPGKISGKEGDEQTADYIVLEKIDKYDRLAKTMRKVVLCKDCKHGKINICDEFTTCYNVGSCLYGNTRKSNWWCADGVKRDD